MKKYKKGILFSAFDLLHSGHIIMLQDAKEQCEELVVGLQYDPSIERYEKNKPIQTHDERLIQLNAVKYVDKIITYKYESDLLKIIEEEKPDIRILGSDYKNKKFTGDYLNIPIYFHERSHLWSTSELRERIYNEEKKLRE